MARPSKADDLLPTIIGDARGSTIDDKHPQYLALRELAFKRGATQDQFSRMLGLEVELQTAKAAAVAPAAAPAAPRKIDGYATMTMAEKLVASGNAKV